MLGSQPEQPVLVLWSVSRMGRTAGPTNGIIRGARAVLGSQPVAPLLALRWTGRAG